MKKSSWISSLLGGAILRFLLVTGTVAGLNPVEIHGYKLFDSITGKEIVIRGIDYYPRPNHGDLNENSLDFYTNEYEHIWQRDIPYLQELGVNAVRLYAVDANETHDAFMCAMDAAGIYVIVALAHDCPTCAITRDEVPDCYPPELKQQGQAVINAFGKYSNTLAFSAGNEVNHFAPDGSPEWNAPCQKKFIRDMREYVASCAHTLRKIPVGLVAADSDRDENALYYNCKSDPDDFYDYAEWYGLNSYVFCQGNVTSFKDSRGFKELVKSFQSYKYSIPVLLTEFGCLDKSFPTVRGYEGTRNFLQAKWLLEEPTLRDIFSGGFAFEYSIEKENARSQSPYPYTKLGGQNYGVGYFGPEDCDDITSPCAYHPLPTFDNLKKVYKTTNVTSNVTRNGFVVPVGRQGRTRCPENFPSLKDFEWEADDTPNSKCPSMHTHHFTCASHNLEMLEKKSLFWLKLVAFAGVLLSFASCLFVVLYNSLCNQSNDSKMFSWISVPISRRRNSGASDSSSEESDSLLSMKEIGDSKTPYQAINMSYSSDEEG